MAISLTRVPQGFDLDRLLEGLPGNLCPCPHWGYLLKGRMTVKYEDGSEEEIKAGEASMVRPRAFIWAIPALLLPVFGCYESSTPLGPSERAVATPKVIGTWTCREPGNEDNVTTLRVLPFDSLRYYVEWTEKDDITRCAVHASSVGGTLLHNVKEIRADGAGPWIFVRVAFPTDAQLQLAWVKNDDLKHLGEDAALRVIERRVRDESLYHPFAICERDEGAGQH